MGEFELLGGLGVFGHLRAGISQDSTLILDFVIVITSGSGPCCEGRSL